MRVLIADDSAMTRRVLQSAVERLGHDCRTAEDGLQAWELYRNHGADVIISDWMMPGLDGPALCRRVRALDGPYTYFLFLTVLEDKQHALVGMQAGADDYLTKPLDPDDLAMRLVAAARVTALHGRLAQRDGERERTLRRQDALLRVGRRFAAEGDTEQLLGALLDEAVAAVEADGGVLGRWDAARQVLVPLRQTGLPFACREIAAGEGVSGRAVVTHATETVSDRAGERFGGRSAEVGIRASIAAPLLHEGKLLGSLTVHSFQPGKVFSAEDCLAVELLASTGAAALVGIERARLDGALLAVRTMEHELNNQLTLTRGYAELLARDPNLPDHLREAAVEALQGALAASATLDRVRAITRVQERHWAGDVGSTLDLARSVE